MKLSSSLWWTQFFQNSNFAWKLKILSLTTSNVNCFPCSDGSLDSFLRKCLQNIQVWITRVHLLVLSSTNDASWKKYVVQLASETRPLWFFSFITTIMLQYETDIYVYFTLCTQNIKKMFTQGWRFNKIIIIIFTASSQHFKVKPVWARGSK